MRGLVPRPFLYWRGRGLGALIEWATFDRRHMSGMRGVVSFDIGGNVDGTGATQTLVIDEQFRGPPNSGNGGYVAGCLARELDPGQASAIEVTLRAPAPLGQPLQVTRGEAGGLKLALGPTLIAEAVRSSVELEVPEPATWDEAIAAREPAALERAGFNPLRPGRERGFHGLCFCCSFDLPATRTLHVQCCAVPGRAQVACPWICRPEFAAPDGRVPVEVLWTALDCPGQMAWLALGGRSGGLLGRMTAQLFRPLHAAERSVIIGWTLGSEGRKFYSGTALFNAERGLVACARATWIGRAA